MAGIGRGLVRAIVNGDIMQTRREQRGQLCRINGEFATTSAMWSSSYGCIASLVQQTKDQSSQQQSSRAAASTAHTECITPTQEAIKFLKLRTLNALELSLIAHDLDFASILHDIEEDQFAPGKSIRTNPT